MTRDDRRYARFYYPEFIRDYPTVYSNDAAFATWMRLLVVAEQMWPMPSELPRSVRSRPLAVLVEAGLVTVDGTAFRLKGHDAERSRRRDSARKGAAVRWDSDGNANAGANAMPSTSTSTSTSRDKGLPPPPTSGGKRKDGTNPRAVGAASRQNGSSLRDQGTSPRQERQAQKRDMTPIHLILARAAANGSDS